MRRNLQLEKDLKERWYEEMQ